MTIYDSLTRPTSKRLSQTLLLAIMVICFSLAFIVPPFQAPDEQAHIQRAYMLAEGQIVLHSIDGSPSGGMVDSGLLDYMNAYSRIVGHPERKVSTGEMFAAKAIHWSEKSAFVNPTGTAYYFPALYLPQALALRLGMTMQLTVSQSYMLARYFTLIACFLILALAFRVFPPPLFILGVLALPMNLFLFSGAVLDGMATAVSVLVLACFMRSITDRKATSPFILLLLVGSTMLVAACRANLLPFLLLPFVVAWLTRDRRLMGYAVFGAAFVLVWTAYTVKFTVYPADPRNIDHAGKLLHYLFHPWQFVQILIATLTDTGRTSFYALSFLGILGALDTPLPQKVYWVLGSLLAILFVASVSRRTLVQHTKHRLLLCACSLGAVLLIFLALLVQWTIEPATTIDGVQGRYFTIPLMVLAYALFATAQPPEAFLERCRFAITAILLSVGACYSVQLLIARYYISDKSSASAQITLSPSLVLSPDKPTPIHFTPDQVTDPASLTRLDLRFGTYMTAHKGLAALHLWTLQGQSVTIPFELSSIVDNAYRRFDLDGKRYVGGEVVSKGGEGVSLYELISDKKAVGDCMVLYSGDKETPPQSPCPSP